MQLAAGLLAGCGGATTIAAAPPVASTLPPPPAMCAYTGELGDLGLVTPRGTSFAYVQAMTGTATFDNEATDLPRLMVDVVQDGVRLRGPADLANPAPLRLVLDLELAPGVYARPGAGPRLVEANPGEVVVGLPADVFAADAGWTFAEAPTQAVACDALSAAPRADEPDSEPAFAAATPQILIAGQRHRLRAGPNGDVIAEVTSADPLAVGALDRTNDGAWVRVVIDDGAFYLLGWTAATGLAPPPARTGYGIGSGRGGMRPQMRCTSTTTLELGVLEEDDQIVAPIGELAPGTPFIAFGTKPQAPRLLVVPLGDGFTVVNDWVVSPATPPTCDPPR